VIPKNIIVVATLAGLAMFAASHTIKAFSEGSHQQSVSECVRGGGGKACEK